MMKEISVFTITIIVMLGGTCAKSPIIQHHHVYYWNIKPYIYESNRTEYGVEGIIPEILRNTFLFCIDRMHNVKVVSHFYKRFADHKDYLSFIKTNFTKGAGRLKEVTPQSHLWMGPFLSYDVSPITHQWINAGLRASISPNAQVIVKRSWISWNWKILEGISNCKNYLILSILASICVGAVVYLLESRHLNEYGQSLPEGIWNGFWWSIVTMTTVGYGDIVPHSKLARLFSLIWLLCGVLLGSVITATVTDSMSSNSHLQIFGKKVAVLDNSWEQQIASTHDSIIIVKDSYDDVLEAVRTGEAFAALINSDIVRWRQEKIKGGNVPLAIVYTIEMTITVRMNTVIYGNYSVWDCMVKFSIEVFETPRRKYHKNIEIDTIHFSSLHDMLLNNVFGLILFVSAAAAIICACVCAMMEKFYFKKR